MKAADLRKSILQAAVQGKLVPQDKNDEPASELLKRIQAEKIALAKAGELKSEITLLPISEDEIPYDLPEGWSWCRLGMIGNVRGGKRIPKGKSFSRLPTEHIYIRVTDMKNGTIIDDDIHYIENDVFQSISRYTISKADIYITIAGTIGESGTVPDKFDGMNLTENAAKLSLWAVNKEYIVRAILSPLIQNQFSVKTNQMAQPKLALAQIKSTIISLPPLAEQQRIVAKLDELMALCDELEAAEKEQETLERRLADGLPKSILQAAVQGKLVPQDKDDEPASELLERIRAEKAALIKAGKLKREKTLPPVSEEDMPYDLPEGWVWCRLGEFIQLLSGRDLDPNSYNEVKNGIPYITGASAISDGKIDIVRWTESPVVISEADDILLSCKGTVGKIAINTIGNCHIARQIMAIRVLYPEVNRDYLAISLRTFISQLQIQAKSIIPGISRNDVLGICFPLPPLAEQQRIVAKVDELMALCEELKHVDAQPIDHSHIIPFPAAKEAGPGPIAIAARGDADEFSAQTKQAIEDLLAEDK